MLLLFSRIHYFKHPRSLSLDSQGVARLLTIPIYLVAIYRAEYAIRIYRAYYNVDATASDFTLMFSEDPSQEGGQFCFAEKEGNVYQWLWVEILAFVCQLFLMMGHLLLDLCRGGSVATEAKCGDHILMKDYRACTAKNNIPTLHVFNT